MQYTMTTPCDQCPFLAKFKRTGAYPLKRLREFASGEFPCHKSAELNEDGKFSIAPKSVHCAGALIFLEKRNESHQMMRICERIGMYDHTKLNMKAKVR